MPSRKRTPAAVKQPKLVTVGRKLKPAGDTPADCKYNDLQRLHDKMNVTKNLKLPQGHRLKLDPPEQLRRKHRPFRDINIEFADLNDAHLETDESEHQENDTDNDDLPESHDILKKVSAAISERTPPSETNYSNSEIDSLIRAVPLDDEQATQVAETTVGMNDRKQLGPQSESSKPSLPSHKRKRETHVAPSQFDRRNKFPKIVAHAAALSSVDRGPLLMVHS
jgi:ATP-dependent DNA helicase HFM1/MER3